MKKQLLLLIAGALITGTAANAQTADEIVKKHKEAVGGMDAWKKVMSIKMTGSMSMQGMSMPIVVSKLRDKGMRMDMDIQGTNNYVIVTPTAAWMFFPAQGQPSPQAGSADQVKSQQDELQITDELCDYAARGEKVEYIGKEKAGDKDCYKLKLTDKDGGSAMIFVDASTYYIVQKVAAGKDGDAKSTMSDYQKLPEGIVVPMAVSSEQGDVKFTKVEVNTIKDDNIFKPGTGKGG